MIQNEYQYKVARVLTTLATEAESLPPLMVEATRNGFQTQINRMQTELQEYDDLKAGKVEITMSSIEDLPKVLIQKRISLGMTQRELAEKLGIKEQMVQRYESTAYESISYQRLIDVWNTLKTSIPMMVVR
jgi:HTH-type transcriptional regulator / antitoxin HipB